MKTFLFDNPDDKENMAFLFMVEKEATIIFSPKEKNVFFAWIKGVNSALSQTSRNATIVCWYDFQAVLCYWLSKLTFKRRKIICINLLLKDKKSTKNKVVAWLYKNALKSKHFVASVTSVEYGKHLKKRLGLNKDLFLLHDVFHEDYKVNGSVKVHPNTVFCGGRNGRDWKFMIDVAKAMPNVEFHLVMPKATYETFQTELPSNVVAKYNLSMEDFMKEMCSCEIVALPLDTEAPAGLIVLFQAAANMKYIITTDTMTTREYLSDGKGSLVANDVNKWVVEIRERLALTKDNTDSSYRLLDFLKNKCSEEKFVEGIEIMIKDLENA